MMSQARKETETKIMTLSARDIRKYILKEQLEPLTSLAKIPLLNDDLRLKSRIFPKVCKCHIILLPYCTPWAACRFIKSGICSFRPQALVGSAPCPQHSQQPTLVFESRI